MRGGGRKEGRGDLEKARKAGARGRKGAYPRTAKASVRKRRAPFSLREEVRERRHHPKNHGKELQHRQGARITWARSHGET